MCIRDSCGHIHNAEIRKIRNIEYMNDGDWVESCTALIEKWDGTWEIYYDKKDTDNHRQSS